MRRLLAVALVATCTIVTFGAPTASADTVMAGPFQGQGTVGPGLDAVPQEAHWYFGGYIPAVHDGALIDVECWVSGWGTDSISAGFGSVDVECWSSRVTFSTYAAYVHVGATLTMIGPDFNATIALQFNDVDPSTSFTFAGAATYVDSPVA